MDCTADQLLVLVQDKTASGTARSKTENIQLTSAMLLLAVPETASSRTKTWSRDQLCGLFSVLLLAVPEAVLSHTKTKRISSTRSQLRQERVPRCYTLLNICHCWPWFSSAQLVTSKGLGVLDQELQQMLVTKYFFSGHLLEFFFAFFNKRHNQSLRMLFFCWHFN